MSSSIFNITENINQEYTLEMFNGVQQFYINLYRTKGIDLLEYGVSPEYSSTLMQSIGSAIENGWDYKWLLNPNYGLFQASLIMKGLSEGLDVSGYANPDYSWDEMNTIYMKVKVQTFLCGYKELE